MGNCCKFIKRSRYRNDEKSVDPIGYTHNSNYAKEQHQQHRMSNGFLHQNQGNINSLAYQSDNSLNTSNNNNNSKSKIQIKTSQHINSVVSNGIGVGLGSGINTNVGSGGGGGGSLKQKNFNNNNNSIIIQPGLVNGYENKLDDVNASIPHIADFYPEGKFLTGFDRLKENPKCQK